MSVPPLHAYNPRRGALYVAAAALVLATMSLFIKHATVTLPSSVAVFLRNVFGLLMLGPWLLRGGVAGLKTRRPWLHAVRLGFGLSAMYCYFYAIAHLPLAMAVLLIFTASLFMPFIAHFWLGERITARVVWAVVVGFVGVAVILRPGWAPWSPAYGIGLLSGLLAAVALTSVRAMSGSEPTTRIVFYFATGGVLFSAIPLYWTWARPTPVAWLDLLAAGACATVAQLLLTRGYAHARAAQAGTVHYATVFFAALYGWLLWGEALDEWTWLGAILICLAGIMVTRAGSGAAEGPGPG